MKSFKWHGIPVNIPNRKIEWQSLGLLLAIELVIIVILIITFSDK